MRRLRSYEDVAIWTTQKQVTYHRLRETRLQVFDGRVPFERDSCSFNVCGTSLYRVSMIGLENVTATQALQHTIMYCIHQTWRCNGSAVFFSSTGKQDVCDDLCLFFHLLLEISSSLSFMRQILLFFDSQGRI